MAADSRRAEARIWRVSFACNNPHNGNPVCSVSAIEFHSRDGHELHLDSTLMPCSFALIYPKRDRVRVGRWVYRILPGSYKSWEGNWCWDAATMSEAEAKRLAARRIGLGWQIEGGTDGCPLDPETEVAHA